MYDHLKLIYENGFFKLYLTIDGELVNIHMPKLPKLTKKLLDEIREVLYETCWWLYALGVEYLYMMPEDKRSAKLVFDCHLEDLGIVCGRPLLRVKLEDYLYATSNGG